MRVGKRRGNRLRNSEKPAGGTGFVRIIGGQWRGRKLPVANVPGLRPSGDRGRETLFNWLQAAMHGARCADLFAGSGALGFEAASRGAAEVTLVEKSPAAVDSLKKSAELLKATQVTIIEGDAVAWLGRQEPGCLDVVFIDPPFDSELAEAAMQAIRDSGVLGGEGLVYLESPRLARQGFLAGWVTVREKMMGDVRMQLLKMASTV